MFKAFTIVAFAAAALIAAEPALAQVRTPNVRVRVNPVKPRMQQVRPPLSNLGVKIKPSQAAALALRRFPGAKVVGVKLLPNGNYAVTLRTEAEVARIMISGEDGSAF